jgi:hypothetical protein
MDSLFPQDAAILLIFRANGRPIVLTSRCIFVSVAVCSFSIMAVTSLASLELFMESTYRTVRSIIPRSTRLKILNQTPRRSAIFFASAISLIDNAPFDCIFGKYVPAILPQCESLMLKRILNYESIIFKRDNKTKTY